MKRDIIAICDIILYLIIFIVLQSICVAIFQMVLKDDQALAMVLGQAVSAVLTIIVFAITHWAHFGLSHFGKKHIPLLITIAIFTLGTLLPSEWVLEASNIDMPDSYKSLFEMILSHPLGIFSIFFLVPIAEEVVLRGAVLRRLLAWLTPTDKVIIGTKGLRQRNALHWVAITISALIFGLLHGNLAQGTHAFVMGLFLGWVFYRTNSILPGLVFHWVNNTASVIQAHIFGMDTDLRVIDMFGGNELLMYGTITISVIVAIISFLAIKKTI